MKRAIPVLALSVAGLVPVWLYSPGTGHGGEISEVAAPETQPRQEVPAPQSAPPVVPPTAGSAPRSTAPGTQQQAPQQQAPQQQQRALSGPAITTSEGVVQVQVTLQGTKITDVKAVRAPNSNPTRMALPLLRQSALKAQSADIDTVSGATATSEGYRQSLQAALDGAR